MFSKPSYFFNRELSWLKFNKRVLYEANDRTNPLLERLRFIAITSSNLDEFFMIRVAGLKHYIENKVTHKSFEIMSPQKQLEGIEKLSKRIVNRQYVFLKELIDELERENIKFRKTKDLEGVKKAWVKDLFMRNVYPVVTPLAIDASRPFPFLANRTINMVVRLHKNSDPNKKHIAILPLPSVLRRILEIPNQGEEREFILLEDVIIYYADQFFPGYTIDDCLTFRVTRDSDLEIDEDRQKDLLTEMQKSLRARRKGMAVRLEVQMEGFKDSDLLAFIMEKLQLGENDLFRIYGPLDTTMYFSFCDIDGFDHLRFKPFNPCTPLDLIGKGNDLFAAIREKDIFLHHPFESFSPVIRFVEQAASDPKVLAIKQTLYRVSSDSPIIAALARAADNGKQVTVLMEVKARFDEENNIIMARKLEKAGCHVIYGLVGLKTHSKITMVVRRDEDGIRRYVHLATGNYNGSTAKQYTDCGIFTCNDEYGQDASAFFNLISGYSDPPTWNKFAVAPLNLREKIVEAIDREIEFARTGEPAYIVAKVNSLLDKNIIEKLYEASAAGVKIDLIVRGICSLRPGMTNISENITVRSIIGRFLEHHRIMYFKNGGKESIYISSADWMPRNLNDRVELMIPIEEKAHKERIKDILNLYLNDCKKAHIMRSDGTYYKKACNPDALSAQRTLCRMAIKAEKKQKMTIIERMKPIK